MALNNRKLLSKRIISATASGVLSNPLINCYYTALWTLCTVLARHRTPGTAVTNALQSILCRCRSDILAVPELPRPSSIFVLDMYGLTSVYSALLPLLENFTCIHSPAVSRFEHIVAHFTPFLISFFLHCLPYLRIQILLVNWYVLYVHSCRHGKFICFLVSFNFYMTENPAQLHVLIGVYHCTDVVKDFPTHWMVIPHVLQHS